MSNIIQIYKQNLSRMPKIGALTLVSPSSVEAVSDLSDSEAVGPLSINDFILIHSSTFAIIGNVTNLSLLNGTHTKIIIKLLATIDFNREKLNYQIDKYPMIGDVITKASPDLVKKFAESGMEDESVALTFADLTNVSNASFQITPKRLFGRHLAVLGTTGSGKSWSMSKIIEETSRFNSKVILVDAVGEYETLDCSVKHVVLGGNEKNQAYGLPYYQLTEEDLSHIFRPEKDIQEAKLRDAIKSLKLAILEPKIAVNGLIVKAHREKMPYKNAFAKHFKEVQRNIADFEIKLLTKQIQNECVHPQRSMTEPDIWGGFERNDIAGCTTLINRIETYLNAYEFDVMFNTENKLSLLEEIAIFIKAPDLRVLRVCLKEISFTNNIREILVNSLARFLMKIARMDYFKNHPLILFIDEAHQFVPDIEKKPDLKDLNAIESIAREGRKYGLTLCLATQRPRDLPGHVLSQMGNFLVHRLVNENDRASVAQASSSADNTTIDTFPNLGSGEACLLGVDFRYPMFISVNPPRRPPKSFGPDFQTAWKIDKK